MPSPVRQIDPPPQVRALSTLEPIDYADAFVLDAEPVERTAEQWARTMLEEAPAVTRATLTAGWHGLGLPVRGGGPDRVLGWPVRRRSDDVLLLGAESCHGLSGELLFQRTAGGVLFATFVRLSSAIARAQWVPVPPIHVRAVRGLLEAAATRT